MPWKTFWVTLLCLMYLLSPIDILPDVLPVLGITDDLTFILLVLAMIKKEVDTYRTTRTMPTDKVIPERHQLPKLIQEKMNNLNKPLPTK